MSFPKDVWDQLKNKTADELIKALDKDGWSWDNPTSGSMRIYMKGNGAGRRRVSIHYHPQKTYGANLLKNLLSDIGWSAVDMRQLKLIK